MKSLLLKYSRAAAIITALIAIGGVVFAGFKSYTYATEDHIKVASIEEQVNDIHTYIVTQAVRDSSLKSSFGELKGEVGSMKGEVIGLRGEVGVLKSEVGVLKSEVGVLRGAVTRHLAITGEIILSQQFPDKGYKIDPNKLIEFLPADIKSPTVPEVKKKDK